MNVQSSFWKSNFIALAILLCCSAGHSQKQRADSLVRLLRTEKNDSARIRLLVRIANAVSRYKPDSALQFAHQAYFLAKNVKDIGGESYALGNLAIIFNKLGNYTRALQFNLQKLKLEEKRNNPLNLASVLMNIGIVYVYQDEYIKALAYYHQADSVVEKYNVDTLKYNIALNIGDAYDRLNQSDSSFTYFNKAFLLVVNKSDPNPIGNSLTGLGHSYRKLGFIPQAISSYGSAIQYLLRANNNETLCEATLGLAKVYGQLRKQDSALHYARQSLDIATKGNFQTAALEAARFMTDFFEQEKRTDSAFVYLKLTHALNDSINGKAKIRELQNITISEQFRQAEMEHEKKLAAKERYHQLQLLLIGMVIPLLFLLTLLLNRVRIHTMAVRLLGILSLLFLFEYLTLLLHPKVQDLTDHNPVLEILIFVVMASILIPAHHRFEQWMIHMLIHHRNKIMEKDKARAEKKAK
jgi:tetratricopeptide (TPR) repeat protein